MRGFAQRLVLLVTVLAFAASLPLALGIPPVLAAEPCPHEHQHIGGNVHHHSDDRSQHQPKPQHGKSAVGCFYCCIGACTAVPSLTANPDAIAPVAAMPVRYWNTGPRLAGRSIRPDPVPPRPIA